MEKKIETRYIAASETIAVRRTEEADLDYVVGAELADDNRPYITPWPSERHAAALQDLNALHLIAEDYEAKPIGFAILRGIDDANRSVELMRIVVTEKGRSHGRAFLKLLQAYAFGRLQAHRLWLDVKEGNERALHLYKSLGFQYEGKLRECLRSEGGGYESLLVLSILEREYASAGERNE